ncbi:MAG: hypothetical protein U0Q16_30875 [Bryobacteraceae bacterium]
MPFFHWTPNWARSRIPDALLAAQAISSGLLWVMLVPVWDGFDEAQHFSYVQSIRTGLPVLGRTLLTDEVWRSLRQSPVSASVQANYPSLRTTGDANPSLPPNYEAHQAPLAYLMLSPLETLLVRAGTGIELRLRLLRGLLLGCSMILFWRVSADRTALFLVLTTEMFFACCGRASNDALAIPLFVWLFFEAEKRSRAGVWLLAAGLLTKASFLAVTPVLVWRYRREWRWLLAAAALPSAWYLRNAWLYGNVSGMQEQLVPLPWRDLLIAARDLPWRASLGETYRGALWLGNNSFLQWSVWQVNFAMAVLLGATWWTTRGERSRQFWLATFAGFHCAGVAYAAVQTFAYTHGVGVAASPWYATQIWLLLIMVIFSSERTRWLSAAFAVTWTYWFIATFWLRLIPWYAGVMDGPAKAANVWRWYSAAFEQIRGQIGDPVLLLAILASVSAAASCTAIIARRP